MEATTISPTHRFAITGGAGFLGYHLANVLAAKGVRCTLIDIAPFSPSDFPAEAQCKHADIRDRAALDRALADGPYTALVHAAAALPLAPRRTIYETNINGTKNVLAAARAANIPRVVYVSSTAVYGVPRKHPIEESDPLVGVGPYGITKIESERICTEQRGTGLIVPIVRPKTFVGTGRLGVFQILYDWVESGCKIPIIGSGKNRYQLLEVEDLVEAIYLCATAEAGVANDTFNVGASQFATVREDVGALCDYAGTGARPMGTPASLVKPALVVLESLKLSPLYKWVYGTADKDSFVSTDRIQSRLGWRPRYSNAEALIRSYQWYLDHKLDADKVTGVTHRVAWRQGMLRPFKWILR